MASFTGMCGRYTLKRAEVIARYGAELFRNLGVYSLSTLYNAAPSQLLPAIACDEAGQPVARTMRWGLVPFWERSEKPKIAPINAKAEEVVEKRVFSQSLQKRRCLIPSDGFFEWKKLAEDQKEPHHIQLKDGAPFFFAGIYEKASEGRPETFAILTTRANELMKTLHDRMPVMLRGEAAQAWLHAGPISADEVNTFALPFPATEMEEWPVSSAVGNPRNSGPELVERVQSGPMRAERPGGEQLTLL